jgi:cytochrome c oxidase cbb3-type subunit 4
MSPVIFHSIWTVALLILFIGIIIWAFSSRRKQRFDAAARMPLEDEDYQSLPLSPGGRRDGEVADVRRTSAPSSGRAEVRAPRREQGERGETVPNAIRGGKHHG